MMQCQVISLSETQVKLWMTLKKKDKRECDDGFQVFAIQIGGAYLFAAGTVEIVNSKSCSSSIYSF